MVNFSKERFVRQNWVDANTEPWKKRKPRKRTKRVEKGATLVRSARLKRSIRKLHVSREVITVGTDVPYAKIHNQGFRGTVNVKAHTRTRDGKKVNVNGFTRRINVPKRQFIGESAVLKKRIERLATAELIHAIKGVL